jgi:mannitol-1-phosphate 5-dehydrogenase
VDEPPETLQIGNVRAVHGADLPAVAAAVAAADIAATAVGVPVMDKIGASLAAGIAVRFSRPDAAPLDVIVCENMIGAGTFMREQVRRHLAPEFHAALDSSVGFVEASIGRMVPVMTDALRAEDPLLVAVESYRELPVDAAGFAGPIPALAHLLPKPNFGAYVERKLFVHNMAHAVAAYLGARHGYTYIWEAVGDPAIRSTVQVAMDETCRALAVRHRLDATELRAHAADLLRRFENRALGDQIARVARDPIRKLGPHDRLIGAMRMCLTSGVTPSHVAMGAAAALQYDDPHDPGAVTLQRLRSEEGTDAVLTQICETPPGSAVGTLLLDALEREQESA